MRAFQEFRKFKNKFHATDNQIYEFLSIVKLSKTYQPKIKINVCRDKKDNFLLELAETANANLLITGDKDLLVLKTWKNTLIMSPANFSNCRNS